MLQAGEEKYRKAWAKICEISRTGYQKLYQRLGVHLEEKVGFLYFAGQLGSFGNIWQGLCKGCISHS